MAGVRATGVQVTVVRVWLPGVRAVVVRQGGERGCEGGGWVRLWR